MNFLTLKNMGSKAVWFVKFLGKAILVLAILASVGINLKGGVDGKIFQYRTEGASQAIMGIAQQVIDAGEIKLVYGQDAQGKPMEVTLVEKAGEVARK